MEKLLKKVQEMDPDERKKLQKLLSDEKLVYIICYSAIGYM